MKRTLFALAPALFVLCSLSCGGDSRQAIPLGSIHQQAPNFTLPRLDGDAVTLADTVAENKVVLVNFWATWCPPCRIELPHLNALHNKYRDKGFIVLAVNVDEDMAAVERFLAENKFDFPVLLDNQFRVQRRYGVNSLPTNVFIDDRQEILSYMRGYTPLIEDSVLSALEYVESRRSGNSD
ncbi:MAG TPA: TlpA disulfide reductase family protein [Acidobacteriota bacterium]|nr:TlpA disulfide reductase family protein [Acidobacteriota bacterium]